MKRTDRIIEAIDVGLQQAGDFTYDQTVGGCVTCGVETDGDDWCAECHPVTGKPPKPDWEPGTRQRAYRSGVINLEPGQLGSMHLRVGWSPEDYTSDTVTNFQVADPDDLEWHSEPRFIAAVAVPRIAYDPGVDILLRSVDSVRDERTPAEWHTHTWASEDEYPDGCDEGEDDDVS